MPLNVLATYSNTQNNIFAGHFQNDVSSSTAGLRVPGYWLLTAAPVEADVRGGEGGARAGGAGLVTVRGGAVALGGGHAVTAVAVEP